MKSIFDGAKPQFVFRPFCLGDASDKALHIKQRRADGRRILDGHGARG